MDTPTIPYYQCVLAMRRHQTTTVRYLPQYEVPLLRAQWAGNGDVDVTPLPAVPPVKALRGVTGAAGPEWPRSSRGLFVGGEGEPATIDELRERERERLKMLYRKGKTPGAPSLFDLVYPVDEAFDSAFAAAIAKTPIAAEPVAPAPAAVKVEAKPIVEEKTDDAGEVEEEHPLCAIVGVGAEIAEELVAAGKTTVDDVAAMTIDELIAIPGIGSRTAKRIHDSATELALGA